MLPRADRHNAKHIYRHNREYREREREVKIARGRTQKWCKRAVIIYFLHKANGAHAGENPQPIGNENKNKNSRHKRQILLRFFFIAKNRIHQIHKPFIYHLNNSLRGAGDFGIFPRYKIASCRNNANCDQRNQKRVRKGIRTYKKKRFRAEKYFMHYPLFISRVCFFGKQFNRSDLLSILPQPYQPALLTNDAVKDSRANTSPYLLFPFCSWRGRRLISLLAHDQND